MGTKATEEGCNPQGLASLGTLASLSSGELRQGQLAGKQPSKGQLCKTIKEPLQLVPGVAGIH